MNRNWLILDVSGLAHRAMHTTGDMAFEDQPTGVLFGVLKEVFALQDRFAPFSTVPCFDVGKGVREKEFPFYKESRRKKKLTDEQEDQYRAMREQVDRLRKDLFPRLGLSNVLWQDGYEADDLIAACCHALPEGDSAVIVSGDKDLYQLLTSDVSVYHPVGGRLVTKKSFRKEYGIGPALWPGAKAIAGDSTDGIEGAKGVGIPTACKFLRGELPAKHKTWHSVTAFVKSKDHATNLKLVTLPYPGTRGVILRPDSIKMEEREKILAELGIRTFI